MNKIDKDILKMFETKENDQFDDQEKDEKKMNEVDFYSILNISRNATDDEIKVAYKKLAFTYHPDKQNNEELKKETQDIFTLITLAKDTLSDPKLRVIYDQFGLEGIEHSKSIVNKYKEVDKLLQALDRIQKENEEDKLIESFSATGSQSISLAYHHEYRHLFFKTLKSEAQFDIKTQKYGSFEFVPSITRKKSLAWFGLEASYLYPITQGTELFLSNSYQEANEGSIQTIGIKSLLSTNTYGSIHCAFFDSFQPSRLGCLVTRQLSPTIAAIFRGTLQKEFWQGSITLKRIVQKRLFEITLECSNLGGLSGSLTRDIPISKKSRISFSLGGYSGFPFYVGHGFTGAAISFKRKVTKVFDIDLSMHFSPSRYLYVIGLHHRYQSLEIPIPIYADISLTTSLVFFTLPAVTLSLIKLLVVKPLMKKKEQRKILEKKEKYAEQSRKAKRKAEMDIKLVQQLVENKVLKEKTKNGLIIQEAIYGKLDEKIDHLDPFSVEFPPTIDVTIPLQYLVEDSKLVLHSNNKKSDLLGFWDPRISEEKQLKVTYFFQNRLHRITVNDIDQLLIPLKSHLVQ
ncbi:hypothetical protein RB653_001169 [Dictyostelium firmibasis]|uniref:J domain-containing protein n=1 Tax=Dictyostelium firmibasis TaxID=79012 RepID=A0AAN7U4L5_9MYCE